MKLGSIILGLLLIQGTVYAQYSGNCGFFSDPNDYIDDPNTLENGLFECGDPNNLTPYGTIYGFEPPLFWERVLHPDSAIWDKPNWEPNQIDCYAALHSSFNPDPNDQDPNIEWSIPSPHKGETFVLLSTGGFDGIQDGDIKGAKICQKVYLNEGDVILGAYFFGTTDYPNFNDYGRIFAQLESNYYCTDSNDIFPDPNELVINGGFDSDTDWERTGLWTIGDPNISDPNIPDPNLPDPNVATYNVYLQQIIDPNEVGILSQTVSFEPCWTYMVSMDVLTGTFNSGSDAFEVTLGNKTFDMTAYANTTITQLFTPTDGNTLTISWDNEGTINIDNVSVKFLGPADEFVIAYESLGSEPNSVPSYGSTGWVEFEHVVEPNQAGPYILQCEVVDFDDTVLATYLAVDGLRICRGGRSEADLNWDCDVNLQDYSILSEAWLAFCPDPPFYDPNYYNPDDYPPVTDPNIPCQLADFDDSWFVDPNDLIFMSGEWLYNADPNGM